MNCECYRLFQGYPIREGEPLNMQERVVSF